MLISPPFLPARGAAQTEEQWLEACMNSGTPGDGAFPISFNLGWHGGVHLTAPAATPVSPGNLTEKVRAIADGTVVFVRQANDRADAVTDPQNYAGGWTDKGCVVIRHDTEIGEGVNATVQFFSIYMHLSNVDARIVATRRVYRKAILGTAGQIYGSNERKIHFEIVCDDTNLRQLVGRSSGDVRLTANGRTDAVFGEMYFHLPVGTEFFGVQPAHHLATASTVAVPAHPARAGHPAIPAQPSVVIAVAYTSTKELIAGMLYAGGQGAAGHLGDASLSTYQLDGTAIGNALIEPDAEYNLYTTAKAISDDYPATARPAPSAVYDLLRFGRVLGPDALTPATAPHWRKVNYPGGEGWVNLNVNNIHKFSDADYPQWKLWKLINDDSTPDSHCNSPIIREWLDPNATGLTPTSAAVRLIEDGVVKKLKKAIYKFPTEWDAATIDARWGWLKTQSTENPHPMTVEDFDRLKAHISELAFWPGGMGIDANHWHFEPREFIRHFRKCGWLSAFELARTFPNKPGYTTTGNVLTALAVGRISMNTALQRTSNYVIPLNNAMRKYGLSSCRKRQAHFLAQVMLETDKWQVVQEYGHGAPIARIPMIQYYAAFYGRGIMQLTWAENFEAYGLFRSFDNHTGAYSDTRITATSTHYWGDPTLRGAHSVIIGLDPHKPARRWAPRYDPGQISLNPHNACDSGGYYWTSKSHDGHHDINRVADRTFGPEAIGRVSVLVNGGGNGYYERQAYAQISNRILADGIETDVVVRYATARGGKHIDIDFTLPT